MARKDSDFCESVRAKIKKWDGAFKQNQDQYHDFNYFTFVDQWGDDEQYNFQELNKTPLTVNKMATLSNHLLGEQRQNTPNLEVVPMQDAPVTEIQIRESILKDIMFSSDSRVIYQTAFQQAIVGGFGAFYVDHDYVDNESFDQQIYIHAIDDPTLAYWDMSAKNTNKTDGMYAGLRIRMSRAMLTSLYGKSIAKKIEKNFKNSSTKYDIDMPGPTFVYDDDNSVTVIHHFEKKTKFKHIYQLSNGRIVDDEEIEYLKTTNEYDEVILIDNDEVVFTEQERKVAVTTIKRYKICGDYIGCF
jgi:hypothetical protein